jgi:hypothetical protein
MVLKWSMPFIGRGALRHKLAHNEHAVPYGTIHDTACDSVELCLKINIKLNIMLEQRTWALLRAVVSTSRRATSYPFPAHVTNLSAVTPKA